MLCSVLSRFALPCLLFVLVDNEILDLCPRLLAHLLPFASARQPRHGYARDKRQETGHRLGLLVAERQASERQRGNKSGGLTMRLAHGKSAPRGVEGFA